MHRESEFKVTAILRGPWSDFQSPGAGFSGTMKEMHSHTRLWPVECAAAWACIWFVAGVVYHINEPVGELSVTYNGHTYTGNPPAITLFERDKTWVLIMTVIVVVAILVSYIDVTVRGRRKYGGVGNASAIVGALLVAFSLFGLLWGLASLGVVGLFLILASRPRKTAVTAFVRGPHDD